MFFDLLASLFHLNVHWSENGSDISISNLNAFDMASSSLAKNIHMLLNVGLLTLLSDAVEDESWCFGVIAESLLGYELQHLFAAFSGGYCLDLAPEGLGCDVEVLGDLGDVAKLESRRIKSEQR